MWRSSPCARRPSDDRLGARRRIKNGFIQRESDPELEPDGGEATARAQNLAALAEADAVWPISELAAEQVRAALAPGVPEARRPILKVIPLAATSDRPRGEPREGDKLILCVGAGEHPKWHVSLIQVFQEILDGRHGCEWRLVLAGEFAPDLVRHLTMARTPGSPVEYLGEVPKPSWPTSMNGAPSPWRLRRAKQAAFAVIDSLWAAKACICPSMGAAGELAAAGGCVAVDVTDLEALKGAIQRLIDDDALRGVLAEQAAARPRDHLVRLRLHAGGQRAVRRAGDLLLGRLHRGRAGQHRHPAGGAPAGARPDRSRLSARPGEMGRRRRSAAARVAGGAGALPPSGTARRPDQWRGWRPPQTHKGGGWFIMGELPHNLSDAEQKAFRAAAEDAGLKTAAVFYDIIPWKMPGLYPPAFSAAHLNYMGELLQLQPGARDLRLQPPRDDGRAVRRVRHPRRPHGPSDGGPPRRGVP
ncbi:MAG: hypothetical protein WDN45_17325 [Caulobacteraceae bacterium]